MPPVASRVRSESFSENAWRSPKGKGGTREWILSGALSIDDAIFADISGVPKDGDPWSATVTDAVCTNVSASWISQNRPGETNGRIRLTATYGPVEFTILGGEAAPKTAGEVWSEYDKEFLTQNIMYAMTPDGSASIVVPINNGDGVDIKVGIMRLRVCKAFADNATIPVAQYLDLSRPPRLNDAPVVIPSLWGRNNEQTLNRGQLLYQGADIKCLNRLIVVTHEFLASHNWNIEWKAVDEKGAPLGTHTGKIYEEASFEGLW